MAHTSCILKWIGIAAILATLIVPRMASAENCPYIEGTGSTYAEAWMLPDYDPGNYSIVVDPNQTIKTISGLSNGQNIISYYYACGLVEPSQTGYRTGDVDYNDFIKQKLDEMKPTLLRFYNEDFREGIGPRWDDQVTSTSTTSDNQERPRRLHWGAYYSTPFGTDEFVKLCKDYTPDVEPMLNVGIPATANSHVYGKWDWTKAIAIAKHYVEYCNGAVSEELAAYGDEDIDPNLEGVQARWRMTTWSGTDPTKYEATETDHSWAEGDSRTEANGGPPSGYFAWLRYKIHCIMYPNDSGSNKRAAYDITYWKIGNEPFGFDDQQLVADTYKEKAYEMAQAMRGASPNNTLKIGVDANCYLGNYSGEWDGVGASEHWADPLHPDNRKKWMTTALGLPSPGTYTDLYNEIDFLDLHTYGGPMSAYGEVFYWCSHRFHRTVTTASGTYSIKALIKGPNNIQVRLRVDNTDISSQSISDEWAEYTWSNISLSTGDHKIHLEELSADGLLMIAWVKLVDGGNETIITHREREYDTLFGRMDLMADCAQKVLELYPGKELLIGECNIVYDGGGYDGGAGFFPRSGSTSETGLEDDRSIHKMKSALALAHLRNRLLRMESSSGKDIISACHWSFSDRYPQGWGENLTWRAVYDYWIGQDHIQGVTPGSSTFGESGDDVTVRGDRFGRLTSFDGHTIGVKPGSVSLLRVFQGENAHLRRK